MPVHCRQFQDRHGEAGFRHRKNLNGRVHFHGKSAEAGSPLPIHFEIDNKKLFVPGSVVKCVLQSGTKTRSGHSDLSALFGGTGHFYAVQTEAARVSRNGNSKLAHPTG
ncbi:MAG: hypothetical protein IPM82_22045 [Saprospiraceae bacterium]|nr:hypothetical protein [Saprospiraceae bacterium]